MSLEFIWATEPLSTIVVAAGDGTVRVNPDVDGLNMAVQVSATAEFLVAVVPEAECLFLCWSLQLHEGTYGIQVSRCPVCEHG
jgi:hypothetical protein